MTATMDSSRNTDIAECISEGHLQFMREYIRRENDRSEATVERWYLSRSTLPEVKYAGTNQDSCTRLIEAPTGHLEKDQCSAHPIIPTSSATYVAARVVAKAQVAQR